MSDTPKHGPLRLVQGAGRARSSVGAGRRRDAELAAPPLPSTGAVIDFAQIALRASYRLFPKRVESDKRTARITISYAPLRDPAWRHWIREVERVHFRHPHLSLAMEVLNLVDDMRANGHWATQAPERTPSDATFDEDLRLVESLLDAEMNPKTWGTWVLSTSGRAWKNRNALARSLLRRALLEADPSTWTKKPLRAPHADWLRQEASKLLEQRRRSRAEEAGIRHALRLIEAW